MANQLSTLSADVVSLRTLEFIKNSFPALNTISTDFSNEPVKFKSKVLTRIVTPPPVSDYDPVNGYVASDMVDTEVEVPLDKFKHTSMAVTDDVLAGTNRKLLDERAGAAAYSLGRQVFIDMAMLITPANFTKTVTATIANTGRNTLTALRKQLVGAPPASRYAMLNTDAFEALTNDDRILNVLYTKELPDYQTGNIYNQAGFALISEVPDLPVGNALSGFAAHKSALAMVARVPEDPAVLFPGLPIPGKIEVATDPDSGLSIMSRLHYDMQKGKIQLTLTLIYGFSVGNQDMGVRLVTA